jgi:hypothetical protein
METQRPFAFPRDIRDEGVASPRHMSQATFVPRDSDYD